MAAGCMSPAHIHAYQEAMLAPAPRTLVLAIDRDERLPFGIARDEILRAAAQAGFAIGDDSRSRYRLYLSAAAGSARAGSFLPAAEAKGRPDWIARSGHDLGFGLTRGGMIRVTAVLIDVPANKEVWRGTGTARMRDDPAVARMLVRDVLAELPSA